MRLFVGDDLVADPAGRLVFASPALPVMTLARPEHGLLDALEATGARMIADSAYRGAGANSEVPQRHQRRRSDTDSPRRLGEPENRQLKHSRTTRPGERANAQLKSWKILRKIRFSRAIRIVNVVQVLIHVG